MIYKNLIKIILILAIVATVAANITFVIENIKSSTGSLNTDFKCYYNFSQDEFVQQVNIIRDNYIFFSVEYINNKHPGN